MKAILTYHSIDVSGSVISLDPATFRRHVAWLASGRVRTTSIEGLLRLPPTADAVSLTFDDGFRNIATVAAPILVDAGLRATVFVVTGAAGATNAWSGKGDPGVPVLRLMDWTALGRLAEQGFTIGVHTRSHQKVTVLGPDELEDELLGAREDIAQELGVTATTFAYPYGAWNATSARAVGSYFTHGCTTALRTLGSREDPALLPRLDTFYFRRTGMLEAWGSLPFACRLHVRAGARRVRHSLLQRGRA